MDRLIKSTAEAVGGDEEIRDQGGRGQTNAELLTRLTLLNISADLIEGFLESLPRVLEGCPAPNWVVKCLVQYVEVARSPLSCMALFEREPETLRTLAGLFALGESFASHLLADPEAFEILRLTQGASVQKQVLRDELASELTAAEEFEEAARILNDFRIRETLRVAYGEMLRGNSPQEAARQLSELCEVLIAASLQFALRSIAPGTSSDLAIADDLPNHLASHGIAIIGLGALGGRELDYGHQIEIIIVRQQAERNSASRENTASLESESTGVGPGAAQDLTADDCRRIGDTVLRLLQWNGGRGPTYIVGLEHLPAESRDQPILPAQVAIDYYDARGRTWQRQVFTNARIIAGDIRAGNSFLSGIEAWVQRRYLLQADESGLAALKRRLQSILKNQVPSRAQDGCAAFHRTMQLMQLVYGRKHPGIRGQSTLGVLHELKESGLLEPGEEVTLRENYQQQLTCHHADQVCVGPQGASAPGDEYAIRSLHFANPDLDLHLDNLARCQTQNARLLSELLNSALSDAAESSPAGDLILDPAPTAETIEAVLGNYGFDSPMAAWRHLESLSRESVSFLSTRRCRHFLAAIAPKLLDGIAKTPRPDDTLVQLSRVTESIGCKGVFWELFGSAPATMDLALRICAASPYLTNLLTGSPGLVDELIDSLMLRKLPTQEEMAAELDELCREAEEIAPLLRNFKNSMHLRIGARNILRKDSVSTIHAALANVAEVCVQRVVRHEFHRLVGKLGVPSYEQEGAGELCDAELVVLAIGKLGGREPNYHSDVDLIFLFDRDGQTRSLIPSRKFQPTSNHHFFNQLAQRIVSSLTNYVAGGRLYDVDVSLRPMGSAGQLAIPIYDLKSHFDAGGGEIWRRLTLCKARVIWGSDATAENANRCVQEILMNGHIDEAAAGEILEQRYQLERGTGLNNLKRSPGGTMDIEFITQLLQVDVAKNSPSCLAPSTVEALGKLRDVGALDSTTAAKLIENYSFLRRVESGLRLLNTSSRHDLPKRRTEQEVLAFLVGDVWQAADDETSQVQQPDEPVEHLLAGCRSVMQENRRIFDNQFARFLPANDDVEAGQ